MLKQRNANEKGSNKSDALSLYIHLSSCFFPLLRNSLKLFNPFILHLHNLF